MSSLSSRRPPTYWLRIGLPAFFVALLGMFLAGPRPNDMLTLQTPQLPQLPQLPLALDAYISQREAAVGDLRPGDARRIVWADPEHQYRRPLALVYLHGFSASPQEVAPLPEDLARALGANLYVARMPGHGRMAPEAMGEATLSDWINEGVEALAVGRRLGERVVLIGTSTGGTLGFWLAASGEVAPPDALVMISPNFGPQQKSAELLLWPWMAQVSPTLFGEWREWTPANAEQGRHWSTRYPLRAVVPMMQLVDRARQLDLDHYQVPTLILRSPHDKVVRPDVTDRIFGRMGAAEGMRSLVEVTGADDRKQHVLAGRILSPGNTPVVEREILSFLRATVPID